MFDGVSSNGTFGPALDKLESLDIPVYQIAAPPQPWNADGQTTDELVALRQGQFTGVVLEDGSHVDSLIGGVPIIDFIAQLLIKRVSTGQHRGRVHPGQRLDQGHVCRRPPVRPVRQCRSADRPGPGDRCRARHGACALDGRVAVERLRGRVDFGWSTTPIFYTATRRYLLTERPRRASLLGSNVWMGLKSIESPASAPTVRFMPWLRNTPSCAIVGRCAGCLLPIYRL